MALRLTLGCGSYDRTIPLADGTVAAAGLELAITTLTPGELFRRQARDAEFDVAEFSLSTYTILCGLGDARFVALPVFPSRMFRHRSIFVNADGGLSSPSELAGKRVGAPEYQQTAGVWTRGIVQHEYGVAPDEIEWYFGTYNEPGPFRERMPVELPASLRTHRIPEETCLAAMLEAGELDAIFAAQAPAALKSGTGRIRRLFPDFETAEQDYYRRTAIFPIMHTVVVRRSILEREPWIAASLYQAFSEAKRVGTARLRADGTPYCGLPWLTQHLAELDGLMGGDPYPYGFAANRETLRTFLVMSAEQGLTPRVLDPAELFASEVLGT